MLLSLESPGCRHRSQSLGLRGHVYKYGHIYCHVLLKQVWVRRAQLPRCSSDWYSRDCGFDPPVRQNSFVDIGHEIISTAFFFIPLIQIGQLSVTGKRMCTRYSLTA